MQFFYFFRLYHQCPEISTERVKGRRFQMRLWSLKLIKYLLIKGFHVKKWYVTCPQTWFEICELHKLLNSKTYLIWGSVKSLRWPECANYLNIYRRKCIYKSIKDWFSIFHSSWGIYSGSDSLCFSKCYKPAPFSHPSLRSCLYWNVIQYLLLSTSNSAYYFSP